MRRADPHKGFALLEVIVALTILACAGTVAVTLTSEASSAIRRVRGAEKDVRAASAFLAAVSLWTRADFDRHLGDRVQGHWIMRVDRPQPCLTARRCSTRHLAPSFFVQSFIDLWIPMRGSAQSRVRRRGFTLIEIIVAMSISAMLLVGARAMLGEVGDDALRITAQAAVQDRDSNSERYFRELIGRLELGGGSEREFAGDPLRATFSSWCDTPGGWQERCRVVVSVERKDNRIVVIARPTIGSAVVLRDSAQRGALRYLITAEGGGSWLQVWGAGITAPLAIAVIVDADTLIIPIGDRG